MKQSGRLLAAIGAVLIGLLAGAGARAADGGGTLPDDPRLGPVRASLQRTIDQARRDGLPSELMVSKVREGLAKGVAPEAIAAAIDRLAGSLAAADRFLKAHRRTPARPELLRAVAEAQAAGVDLEAASALTASSGGDTVLVRAIEVLTELARRGYPGQRAVPVVEEIATRDPGALGRVVAGVEQIRSQQTLSRADALQALQRNLTVGGNASFDAAMTRALEDGDRAGNATPGSPGKSGQAPGHSGDSGASKGKGPKK